MCLFQRDGSDFRNWNQKEMKSRIDFFEKKLHTYFISICRSKEK